MTISYPTSLDTFSNPIGTDKVNNAVAGLVHSTQHSNANDAIEALEAKVGANSSAVTTSHDYKLGEVTGSDKAVGKSATQTLTNKTLTTPVINGTISGTTVIPVANGGVGVALADPNADRILFWDDSAGQYDYLTAGSGLTISGTTMTVSSSAFTSSFTADEDITIGQTVGISALGDNKVARAARINQDYTIDYTAVSFGGYDTSIVNNSCPIGGDKFVSLGYSSASGETLRVIVGSVNTSTKTVTYGASVSVATGFAQKCSISKLDTDKFIMFYVLDASAVDIKYRVGTVSGTTITLGTEATFTTTATNVSNLSSYYISADKGVMVYSALTTGTNARVIAFTTSGTVATAGTPQTMGANVTTTNRPLSVTTINTDKFVIYSHGSSCYAQVGTCSGGTTITMGTEQLVSTGTPSSNYVPQVVVPANDVFVSMFIDGTTPSSGTAVFACTVSGTTITAGTPVGSTLPSSLPNSAYALSASSIVIGSSGSYFQKYSLSGTTLTLVGTINSTNTGATGSLISMDNGYFVGNYATSSTTVKTYIQGMSNIFTGIAQATASKGNPIPVLYSGTDSNQTGLIAGGIYNANQTGGLSSVNINDTSLTHTQSKTVTAISATEVII